MKKLSLLVLFLASPLRAQITGGASGGIGGANSQPIAIGSATVPTGASLVTTGDIIENGMGLWRPTLPRMKFPNMTTITNWQPGHGFTLQSGTGAQSNSTEFFAKGNQSMCVVSDGVGGAVFSRKTTFPSFNLKGKQLAEWVRVTSTNTLAELSLYLCSDTALSNCAIWKAADDTSQLKESQWQMLTYTWARASPGGVTLNTNYDQASNVTVQVRIKDNAVGTSTVCFGGLAYFDEPNEGFVNLNFDDGRLSVFTEARAWMDTYSITGDIYLNPSLIGTASYMSSTHVVALQDINGWGIGVQYVSNQCAFDAPTVEHQLLDAKNFLLKNGWSTAVDMYSYPNGCHGNGIVERQVQKYFTTARTISNYPETIPPADYMNMRMRQLLSTVSSTTAMAWVNDARDYKYLLSINMHEIVGSPTASTQISTGVFKGFVTGLAASGVRTGSLRDLILEFDPQHVKERDGTVFVGSGTPQGAYGTFMAIPSSAPSNGNYPIVGAKNSSGTFVGSFAQDGSLRISAGGAGGFGVVAFSSAPIFPSCGNTGLANLGSGTTFYQFTPQSAITLTGLDVGVDVAGVAGSGDFVDCGTAAGGALISTGTSAANAAGTRVFLGGQSQNVAAGTAVTCWIRSAAATKPELNMCLQYQMQ